MTEPNTQEDPMLTFPAPHRDDVVIPTRVDGRRPSVQRSEWTPDTDAVMLALFAHGHSVEAVARRLGRTDAAVTRRMSNLGISIRKLWRASQSEIEKVTPPKRRDAGRPRGQRRRLERDSRG
jgi:hypothetical protein